MTNSINSKPLAAFCANSLIRIVALLFAAGAIFACAGSKLENTLVVYTYEAFPEPLIKLATDHFAEGFGVGLTFERFSDTGGVFNALVSEKADPNADVVLGLDTTFLERILSEQLFEPYRPAGVDAIDEKLIVDRTFHAVVFDYGGVTLNYDTKAVDNPPSSWSDLLDPAFEKSIILMNPATSSPGRNFLLFTILEFGQDGYLEFWAKLKPNILTITGSWYEGYGLYTQGEATIVLSYETSPAYHIEFEDTHRYANIFLDGMAYGQMEIAGIVADSKHRKNAERFMDYLLSADFQREIPLNQFMYPVHNGVELPESFIESRGTRTLVSLNPSDVSKHVESWIKAWEAVMR